MARRITRRNPLSISIASDTSGFFNQTQFNGICDNKNDTNLDAMTFESSNNMYIDEGETFTSRPPARFHDGEAFIVKEVNISPYTFRLYRIFVDNDGSQIMYDPTIDDINLMYILRCTSHDTCSNPTNGIYSNYSWTLRFDTFELYETPALEMVAIEDLIYIWFGGMDFLVFDTIGELITGTTERYPCFKGTAYLANRLYYPIKTLSINGIETEFETSNFLTSAYRKRHHLSNVSSVNFEKLVGKYLQVRYFGDSTQGKSKYLYEIAGFENYQEKGLIFPYSQIGNNYVVDMIETSRATVYMRYSIILNTIEISFDGKLFKSLPPLKGIIGEPMLTKDGLYVVAFTKKNIAKAKLVAQESSDFTDDEDVFKWNSIEYLENSVGGSLADGIAYGFAPKGYFQTIDNYAYLCKGKKEGESYNTEMIFSTWLSGTGPKAQFFLELGDDVNGNWLASDDFKLHFLYVTPTSEYEDIGPVISILVKDITAGGTIYPMAYLIFGTEKNMTVNDIKVYKTKGTISLGSLSIVTNVNVIDDEGVTTSVEVTSKHYNSSCSSLDIKTHLVDMGSDEVEFKCVVVTNIYCESDDGIYSAKYDTAWDITYLYEAHTTENNNIWLTGDTSNILRIKDESTDYFTDKYLFVNEEYIKLPIDGGLYRFSISNERNLSNKDLLFLTFQYEGSSDFYSTYEKYIHKLTPDGINLAYGNIVSGDIVSYTENAFSARDFLRPGAFSGTAEAPIGEKSNRFIIEKCVINEDGEFVRVEGEIEPNGLIVMTAYDEDIILPVGNIGNPYEVPLTIKPYHYPEAPEDWNVGDAWPSSFPVHPPMIPEAGGTAQAWLPGDTLPTGPIQMMGIPGIEITRFPIHMTESGIYYNIDGTLWTSVVDEGTIEIDEFINVEYGYENGKLVMVSFPINNSPLPTHHSALNEYYFSFEGDDNTHLLEVTATRRDEDKRSIDINDQYRTETYPFLLYLPKINEQLFTDSITNLHPVSDVTIAVFTKDEIWNVSTSSIDNTVVYTRPTKSKLPIGCREGDKIITGPDGQTIILPTVRGIAALAPQDFVSTEDKALSYMSDNIQVLYDKFYNDGVYSAARMPNDFDVVFKPNIGIHTYKYWLMFYRYLDRTILLLDLRNSSWWVWETQYPIISISSDVNLYITMQIDFNPMDNGSICYPPKELPLGGVSFRLDNDFEGYYDDVVANTLNGESEMVYDEKSKLSRRLIGHASPTIDWNFTSQKLHFNELNNYKTIKGINLSLKGENGLNAIITRKTYRHDYHPTYTDTVEVHMNEIYTFVKRMNAMRTLYFQYSIGADLRAEEQTKINLNSLSIKYEVKERIR